MTDELKKKVERSVKLIRVATAGVDTTEVCYSGGKDSDVILELTKMAGINYRAIYKNTTIDPPGTISHCKSMGVEIMRPKMRFFDIIKNSGMPSRFVRKCCSELKEYKILDNAIIGIRKDESVKRAKLYDEAVICRLYGSKENHVNQILPILEWTAKDVEDFIKERGIKCHPLYYDEQGNFHVERRLGCIGCPLAGTKSRRKEYKQYPKILKESIRAQQIFFDTHNDSRSCELFMGDAYKLFYIYLFHANFNSNEIKEYFMPNLFGVVPDCKKYLEKYFGIDLTIK